MGLFGLEGTVAFSANLPRRRPIRARWQGMRRCSKEASPRFYTSRPAQFRVRRVPVPARGDPGRRSVVVGIRTVHRDLEELLAERRIEVDYMTWYRWV
jgi:hypothetical protein